MAEPAEDNAPLPPPAYEQPAHGAQLNGYQRLPRVNRRPVDSVKSGCSSLSFALNIAYCALPLATIARTLSIGSLSCMSAYVNNSGFSATRQLLWPVWFYAFSLALYALVVLLELTYTCVLLAQSAWRYMQKDGASWRMLLRWVWW